MIINENKFYESDLYKEYIIQIIENCLLCEGNLEISSYKLLNIEDGIYNYKINTDLDICDFDTILHEVIESVYIYKHILIDFDITTKILSVMYNMDEFLIKDKYGI